jgi:deoxyribonuclease-1
MANTISSTSMRRVPEAVWKQMSGAQRTAIIEQRRQSRGDGFEGTTTATQAPAPQATIAARPDPLMSTTGLDPAAMHELFGGVVDTKGLDQLEGQALMDELRRRFFSKHVTLDYNSARARMFTVVDNDGGDVHDVYAGRTLKHVTGIPSATGSESFNTEHTWPQSQLKRAGKITAVSDLHHLFPVDTEANGKRGSFPFGIVQSVMWERNGSKLGRDADGQIVFEPTAGHRGDVARAMFWIATAYGLPIPNGEEKALREWASEDPVDAHEQDRNVRISRVQGDLNPYIIKPELISHVADF